MLLKTSDYYINVAMAHQNLSNIVVMQIYDWTG